MSELSTQDSMAHVEQLTEQKKPQKPRLVPATSDGGVWDRLHDVIEQHGEFADIETEPGIVRKVAFAYPRQIGMLSIREIPDPQDLDGDLAYHVLRVDHRGEAEAIVSHQGKLGQQAVDAIHWDLDLYANSEQAELYKKRMASAASWLIQPLLLLNTMRPSLKRFRVFDQSQQYRPEPVLTKEVRKKLHAEHATEDRIPISGGTFVRPKTPSKSLRVLLLGMGASHEDIEYVFQPNRRRK